MEEKAKKIVDKYLEERGFIPQYIEKLAVLRPEALVAFYQMRSNIVEKGIIPRKYKELMLMAICLARLYGVGVQYHSKAAMKFGATKDEVFEAMLLGLIAVGVPGFSTAIRASYDSL